eukprot:1141950-Pelagomonas_calceolata.AAC.4
MRGLQGQPVKIVEGIPGVWKCNVRGVHECCSACAGVSTLVTNDTRVRFNLIELLDEFCMKVGPHARRVKGLLRDLREAGCTIRGYVGVPWQNERLPLHEGTCVSRYGCHGEGIKTSSSNCLILGVEYAVVWQNLEVQG